jgi:DMSO/TMAO reductase YedYZ molybdopterin-dependent catalytic subunit
VRAIVPGWYATDSIKWLARVWFSTAPFEGPFEALDYRFSPPGSLEPGRRLAELPVSSLITTPRDGAGTAAGPTVLRGIAWGGRGGVVRVEVRIDDGPWESARLRPPRSRYARAMWEHRVRLAPGSRVVASRAFDRAGEGQPLWPVPNRRGYANNAVHRVHVVAA